MADPHSAQRQMLHRISHRKIAPPPTEPPAARKTSPPQSKPPAAPAPISKEKPVSREKPAAKEKPKTAAAQPSPSPS